MPFIYKKWVEFLNCRLRNKVSKILRCEKKSVYYESDHDFNRLQNKYNGVPEYGYDSYSTWKRGVDRANELLRIGSLSEAPKNILEAGCGDGMAAFALHNYSHRLTLVDMEDWRDKRAKGLNFQSADLNRTLPFKDEEFDLVYSFNTFEHLYDPEFALNEFMRICKPGGYIFLEFGPLYASPWGLHAYRMFKMPYPQFLFSEEFIGKKLQETGISDLGDNNRQTLQFVNKWTYTQYVSLFDKFGSNLIKMQTYKNCDHLQLIADYPSAFTGLSLSIDDVTTSAIKIIFKKGGPLE